MSLLVPYYISVASFYVENFGCRATQADGAAIERQFTERGLQRAAHAEQASIVVLNTCTVTSSADQDARAAIRRVHRENPECQIVVTGCYAQRAPEEIAALPGVTWVVGNSHKQQLVDIVVPSRLATPHTNSSLSSPLDSVPVRLRARPDRNREENGSAISSGFVPMASLLAGQRFRGENRELKTSQLAAGSHPRLLVGDIFAHTELLAAPVFDSQNQRTRPNLKVQDGCDNRCSFCIIPYVRGQSRSLRLNEVIREVEALVTSGYREVVISGINLGRWGRDLVTEGNLVETAVADPAGVGAGGRGRGLCFEDLVREILKRTSLEKLRISSVEPMDWSDSLISLVAQSPRIAKHAHVPLQSASDRVLRAMHRKYRPWHYREKILKIREAMPSAAIGADVMVGFPGESDSDFEETRRMVEELPFTYLHVFTYSSRPGTSAAEMEKQVPLEVRRERNRVLRALAEEKKLAFMNSFLGKAVQAITLNIVHGDYTQALTDNYLKLWLGGQLEANQWVTARVGQVSNGALLSSYDIQ